MPELGGLEPGNIRSKNPFHQLANCQNIIFLGQCLFSSECRCKRVLSPNFKQGEISVTKLQEKANHFVTGQILYTQLRLFNFNSGVEIQHSPVSGSQLSLALLKAGVYICSCLAMIGQRA